MSEVNILIETGDPERSEHFKNLLARQLEDTYGIKRGRSEPQAPPPGAFSADAIAIGALVLSVSQGLVAAVLNMIKEMKLKNKGMSIRIKVKDKDREIEIEIPEHLVKEKEWDDVVQEQLDKLNAKK